MNLLKKKIPLSYTLVFALACSAVSFFILQKSSLSHASANEVVDSVTPTNVSCNYTVARLKGYKYIKPLLNNAPECEAKSLESVKQEISTLIENEKQSGIITSASVYLKELSSDDWTAVNPGEGYLPGSLFKLPVMLTILRMAETDPALLNKKILYTTQSVVNVKQTYETKSIQSGQSYTVKELLTYMIAYSDNNATQLLNGIMKPEILIKVFSDLGLTPPKPNAADYLTYTISTHDYSIFMEALYNASYLTIPASEFATSLLAQCNFKDGLVKGLPDNVKIAHKFGEAGSQQLHQLHETGIVYLNNTAYLITVMTKGTDLQKLTQTISEISKITYARMNKNA